VDSLERMNKALAYIEENLGDEIDFQQVERVALCSEYHFRRMFSFLAGVSLSEYIRRRRLTLAAFELLHRDLRVIDLALKYGYRSPDAFTRAFASIHGVTPAEARSREQPLNWKYRPPPGRCLSPSDLSLRHSKISGEGSTRNGSHPPATS
jgi:AraC family transcriptional regulator